MGSRPKFDWPTIRKQYEAGRSALELAQEHGCSERTISGRAREEDWHKPPTAADQAAKAGQLQPAYVIANLLNISHARLLQLQKNGVIPKPPQRGLWDLVGCVKGYVAYLQQRVRNRVGDEDGSDLVKEKERLTREQADKVARENRQADLIMLDGLKVIEHVRGIAAIYAQELDSLPAQLCDEFPGHTAENRVRLLTECRRIRSRTADTLEAYAERLDQGHGGNGQASPQ